MDVHSLVSLHSYLRHNKIEEEGKKETQNVICANGNALKNVNYYKVLSFSMCDMHHFQLRIFIHIHLFTIIRWEFEVRRRWTGENKSYLVVALIYSCTFHPYFFHFQCNRIKYNFFLLVERYTSIRSSSTSISKVRRRIENRGSKDN